MSKLQDIREALDTRLDELDGQIEALEAQFESTREEVWDRIEHSKSRLGEAARGLARAMDDATDRAEDIAAESRTEFDHLKVQLALGRAETLDSLREQRENLHVAIDAVEARLGRIEDELGADLAAEMTAFLRAGNRLRAELEAAELQFALLKAESRNALARGRQELEGRIRSLRAEFAEKKHSAQDRLEGFEAEIRSGLGHIRRAFAELFG